MQLEELEKNHQAYRDHVHDNEFEIIASKECGCIECGKTFSARAVTSWAKSGNGLSAICPNCGFEGVVGDASGLSIDPEDIADMRKYHVLNEEENATQWNMMRYCTHFMDRDIEDNEHNEELYVRYLKTLFKKNADPYSALALARVYLRGLTYVPVDIDQAISYYEDESLVADASGLYELGLAYELRGQRGDSRKAFESFSKSAALGSLNASACIGNMYLRGDYVKKNELFGLNALLVVFDEMVGKVFSGGVTFSDFATTAFNIGVCFYHGIGAEPNRLRALRYLLLSQYAIEKVKASEKRGMPEIEGPLKEMLDDIRLHDLHPNGSGLLLDEDTFFDSFYEQYDAYCQKELTHVEMGDSGSEVRFGIVSTRPLFVIDCGNGLIDAMASMEWFIAGGTFTVHPSERRFERIEFEGQNAMELIHDDPVFGAVKTLRIEFAPEGRIEQGNQDE